jgi:SEC-C motif-containing protein
MCVCGLPDPTEACCGAIIAGRTRAETAEALMRSRYAAYALGEIDWILATHEGRVDRASTEAWSKRSEWLGLEILSRHAGGPDDDEGEVEFVARFRVAGKEQRHHERARFRKRNGRWIYADGKEIKGQPQVRQAPATGRNDPCPCGSGKKYKKCCGRDAAA